MDLTSPESRFSSVAAAPARRFSGRKVSVPSPSRGHPEAGTSLPILPSKTPFAARPRHEILSAEEPRGGHVHRPPVERLRCIVLLQRPVQDQGDAVREHDRLLLVVGDEDRRDAHLLLQPANQVAHLEAQMGVEVRQGLVEQQHLGLDDERARQRDPLLLPPRELLRAARPEVRQPDQLEHLSDAPGDLGLGDLAHLEAEADVVGDAHVGEQQVVLEHHHDAAVLRLLAQHRASVECHVARRRREQPRDHLHRRGLAAPRRPEQRGQLAALDLERQVVHRRLVRPRVDLGQPLDGDVRHICPKPPTAPLLPERWRAVSTRMTIPGTM